MNDPGRPKGAVISTLITGLFLVGIAVLLAIYGRQLWHLFRNPVELRELVTGLGPWAPLGIITFQLLQIVVAPLPGHPLSFAVGYAYGFWPGVLWLMVGIMLGATVNFLLSRLLGRQLLRFFLTADRLERIDRMVIRRGTFYIFLLILIPNPIGDLAYYLAGLTPLPLPAFLALVFIARLPTTLLECGIGSRATGFGLTEWLILAVFILLAATLYFRNQQRISRLLEKWSHIGHRTPQDKETC